MRRVSSSNVLVVPPFEVAWASEETSVLNGNAGCITFEARGDNDATVMLRTQPGSTKRIQQLEYREADSNDLYEPHYTVIFGSHQNSCLKIERNSQECYRWDNAATVCGSKFTPCWVSFEGGRFKMGAGVPGSGTIYSWEDPMPIENVKYVGFGSWNNYVCFKNIKIQPSSGVPRPPTQDLDDHCSLEGGVMTLSHICKQNILANLSFNDICNAVYYTDLLSPDLDDIAPRLLSYLVSNLEQILELDPAGICQLSPDILSEICGHPYLRCREIEILNLLALWAYEAQSSLKCPPSIIERLLPRIRFPLMSSSELQAYSSHPLVQDVPLLGKYLEAGGKGQRLEFEDNDMSKSKDLEDDRYLPPSRHLMFVSSGDGNGVSDWLGTSYGSQNWVNPILSGMMKLSASSPICKHTDPKAVVSHAFQRLNFAGPGKSGTWWKIDLGSDHRLVVNYYTIRHDGSADYPRNWSLQGSIDGEQWIDLKVHDKDMSLNKCGQIASWPVKSPPANLPYQMFRLLMQGPNASIAGNRMTFHLSSLELYGQFFKLLQ